jgi:hypothetical protein
MKEVKMGEAYSTHIREIMHIKFGPQMYHFETLGIVGITLK